ncbi:DNA methyltransferase [Jiangella mangrovi]|uniref:Adenine-specific DNA-methyltransferase n=1 Tax=Jiangella mangrovi TaxID=1524084 RepID=A0A7W9GMG2_9ACTN|nr:adenine-specific DNA-methyltransferase [Jiangella mangrovi]
MSRISDLLRQLRATDEALAADLEREVAALADRRAFGLNFERHVPEVVELPGRKVRKGDKVRVLPLRCEVPTKAHEKLWQVVKIDRASGTPTASLEALDRSDASKTTAAVDGLVVVAEFRDPIYPGLVSTGKVERGGNKPFHTVINAENYHALQVLLFTHRSKVDAIYIDPPYNTGAKDWKYNNDYVEGDDLYRHSKWLAFMERRLLLAKELLNPYDSVLIVTIDEKEYLRLGLLLEQVFPEAKVQMVTSSIKPSGSQRSGEFSRVEEYIFFVMLGTSGPSSHATDMLRDGAIPEPQAAMVTWHGLRRRGSTDWRRSHRPNGFYPLHVSELDGTLVSVGEPLPPDAHRSAHHPPNGTFAVWPLDPRGEEGRWQVSPDRLREQLAAGTAALRSANRDTGSGSVVYLKGGDLSRIASGELKVVGLEPDGRVRVTGANSNSRRPKTMWLMDSHDASAHGTALLTRFVPDRRFPFPKSLYAVEDSLRFFVGEKPEAVIIDYFSGSGTTTHAVMRLNKQDGGRRRSICITNNEVAAAEQRSLRGGGLRPGDPKWEQRGICEYITKPRIQAAITGRTPDGQPIKGDYKFTDEFPMADGLEENVGFFTLTYEAPLRVASNREFARIAPLLWLRAGSCGRQIDDISKGWDVADTYGVLAELDHTEDFLKAVAENDDARIVYIVTDEDRLFESVSQELPDQVEPVRLYEAYLRNFEIESGRGAL